MFNLVRNAIEAMAQTPAAPRRLTLYTSSAQWREAPAIRFCVQDSGPGFGGLDPARLFDAYFTTKPDGLGQGLSICRSIIETHDGHITAEVSDSGSARLQFVLPQVQLT